jgi:hypothetical protein
MLFDSEIRKQINSDPRGPVAAIVITDLPPKVGVNSNYTELLVLAAAHQLAPAIDQTPPLKIESDAMSILAHADKECTKVAGLPDNMAPLSNDPPSEMELPRTEGSSHEVALRGRRESQLHLQLKGVQDLGH